jgi:hypothetical protein
MSGIDETQARLNTHEAVCAERYEGINVRLDRLEKIILATCGVLIIGMGSLLATLMVHQK